MKTINLRNFWRTHKGSIEHALVHKVLRTMKTDAAVAVEEAGDVVDTVSATKLAELAADEHDLYEDKRDYTILEWVFDLSAEVAGAYGWPY